MVKGTVLVSGGSGYIAGETIRQLLAKGWTVHTTVRSLSREAELRAQLGGSPETLKFFATDLTSDAGWAEAMAGCSHVCHMASPFPTAVPKDENDIIVPARDGALRALRFAKAAGATRFVMTSSAAAIAYGHPDDKVNYDESDWTNVNAPGIQPYVKSKAIAERAAVSRRPPGFRIGRDRGVAAIGRIDQQRRLTPGARAHVVAERADVGVRQVERKHLLARHHIGPVVRVDLQRGVGCVQPDEARAARGVRVDRHLEPERLGRSEGPGLQHEYGDQSDEEAGEYVARAFHRW